MRIPVEQQNSNLKNKLISVCSTSQPPTLFGIQYNNLQGNRMKEKFWNFQKLPLRSSCTFYRLQLMSSLDLFAIQKPICILAVGVNQLDKDNFCYWHECYCWSIKWYFVLLTLASVFSWPPRSWSVGWSSAWGKLTVDAGAKSRCWSEVGADYWL